MVQILFFQPLLLLAVVEAAAKQIPLAILAVLVAAVEIVEALVVQETRLQHHQAKEIMGVQETLVVAAAQAQLVQMLLILVDGVKETAGMEQHLRFLEHL